MLKDTRLSPSFRAASDGMLGGAWKQGNDKPFLQYMQVTRIANT